MEEEARFYTHNHSSNIGLSSLSSNPTKFSHPLTTSRVPRYPRVGRYSESQMTKCVALLTDALPTIPPAAGPALLHLFLESIGSKPWLWGIILGALELVDAIMGLPEVVFLEAAISIRHNSHHQ